MPPVAVRPVALLAVSTSGLDPDWARELADHGHNVVLAADDDRVHEAAALLPGTAHALRLDPSSLGGACEVASWVCRARPLLRVVVLDAGSAPLLALPLARSMTATGGGDLLLAGPVALDPATAAEVRALGVTVTARRPKRLGHPSRRRWWGIGAR